MDKSPDAFRTISEVADWLGTPTHVLRFWESRFSQVKPVKRAGGRRYYRPKDMALLGGIKKLLHEDGMTIRGVQKLLRENGVAHVEEFSRSLSGDDAQGDAPIVLNADAQAIENVVPLNKLRDAVGIPEVEEASVVATDDEPSVDPALEVIEAQPEQDKTATEEPPKAEPRAAGPFVAHIPDEDATDEPENEQPAIIGVAAALRAAQRSPGRQKPSADVVAEAYARLKSLRAKMDQNGGQDSSK